MKSRFDKGEGIQHFSLRKLSIGVASVLLGTSFMTFGAKTVHADSQNNDSNQNNDDTSLKTTTAGKFNSAAAKNNYITQSELAQKNQNNSKNNSQNKQATLSVKKENKAEVKDTQDNSQKSVEKSASPKADSQKSNTTGKAKNAVSDNKENQKNISNPKDNKRDTNELKIGQDKSLTAKELATNKATTAKTIYTEAQIRHAFDLDKSDLSDAQLKALDIDRDTYIRDGIKYKVTGTFDAYLDNGQTFVGLPFHVTHNADGSFHNLYYDDEYQINAVLMRVHKFGFHYAYAPIVQGGIVYIQKGNSLGFADAERGLPKNYDDSYQNLVWDTRAQGYNVDTNKVGRYHGVVDITYKNQLGVSTGIKVVVLDPKGKTVYVTQGDPIDSAEEDFDFNSVPANTVSDITWVKGKLPSTSTTGTSLGHISVTFPDGSKGDAVVTYIVSDPQTKNETVYPGQAVTPQEIISNPGSMPAGTTYTWTNGAPNTTVPGSTVDGLVTVTYPDGHSHVVTDTITVISANGKPATTVNVNDPLPDASTIITNIGSMPQGTTYTWETQPSTAQPGQFPSVVDVKYPSGIIQRVPTTVIVVGSNTPATITVKDNSKVVTRVIVDNVPGQNAIVTWQEVHYSRDVTYDTKTGKIVKTGDWAPTDTPTWAQYTAKGATGYTPNISVVAAQNVTPDMPNKVVSIVYTLNGQPTTPTQPTQPTKPVNPTNPTQPTSQPSQPTNVPPKPIVNPTSPSNTSNPTTPKQPTNIPPRPTVNPTSPSNTSNPTTPKQPTNVRPRPTVNPSYPKQPTNPGNNGQQGGSTNHPGISSNIRPLPESGGNGSYTGTVAPKAEGNGTGNGELPANNAAQAQSALPQTGESTQDEAMAAAGMAIAVGSGIFVMIGADKRHKIN